MLRLDADRGVSVCDGLTRRDFLHAGALPLLGLTLPGFFARQAAAARRRTRTSTVSCCFCSALPVISIPGIPKPKAPAEIRGPFKPIATKSPGIHISEIFPKMAQHADKYSLIRSVYHTAAAVHDTGHQMMQTGRLFTGGIEHPHVGCVLGYLKGQRGEVPAHVLLPRPMGRTGGNMPHGQTAGYLGKQYDPFVLNADPSAKDFKVPDLLPPEYISAVRAGRRQKMRDAVEGGLGAFEKNPQAKQLDDNFNLAYRLMSSPQAREAFALDKEPAATRDRYGRTRFGQSCLLARRLIERGVRFVTVNMYETVFDEITWDIHGSRPFTDIAEMSRLVAPNFDQAYSTLLEDLHDRGLLKNDHRHGDGRVWPHAEDQPGRRPRSSSGRVDDPDGRRSDPGRPHRRRIRRAGLHAEDAAGHAGDGGGDDLQGTRSRSAPRTAGTAEPPAAAGRLRCGSRSRSCFDMHAAC